MELLKRIKILFFTTSLGGGGAEMHFMRVFNALSEEKFEKKIALARPGGSYEVMLNQKSQIMHLNKEAGKSSTLSMVKSYWLLKEEIEIWQPDLIFTVLNLPAIVAILATKNNKKKPLVICSIQNTLSTQFNQSITHKIQLYLLKKLLPSSARTIALSVGVESDIKEAIPQIAISQIYNAGFDQNLHFLAKENIGLPVRKTKFVWLSVGRLTKQKGFPILFNALAKVTEKDWEMWIVGTGPDLEMLKSLAEKFEIATKIKFLGFQKNPFAFMASADCLLLPSLWEGFGNVIVESMAVGTPVIATNCFHGPSEIIEHNVNGILVPVNNPEKLAEAIDKFASDAELRNKLKANAPIRAAIFSAQNIARKHEALFLEVFNEKA